MAAGATIKIKRKSGAFTNGELAAGELGLDVTNSKLYTSNDGSTVYQLDTIGLLNIVEDTSPQLGGNLDAQGNKITSLGTPTSGTDAATKTYVDAAVQGLRWDDPVIAIQTDNTLDPGASPATGARYIIENAASLHANFGTISGLGDDDIVEYNGSAWAIDFDASVTGEGETVYNKATNSSYTYNGSAWVVMGGSSDHGALSGLGDDDHTQYSIITSGTSAPSSTPARIGAIYVRTDTKDVYVAKGSSSSADWVKAVRLDDTLNNAGMTIDGGTI